MAAAVRLVSENGTTALPVIEISDAADVSRQLVYIQFGDRDSLLVAAAADLVERELLADIRDGTAAHRDRLVAMARHFAEKRSFYRAMLTGTCGFAMARALNRLFAALVTAEGLREVFGEIDETTSQDLASLMTSGIGAIVNEWVIDAAEPLDPEGLADRLLRVSAVLARNRPADVAGGSPR